MRNIHTAIEPLESRIAPASVFVFTDIDGDHVKITSSKGDLSAANVVNLSNAGQPAMAVGKPHELQQLNLDSTFSGATITITATPSTDLGGTTVQGDGFTNVGEINAQNVSLKSVAVHGDLAKILAGSTNTATLGLGSLVVQSIGNFGTDKEIGATPDLVSRFQNGVGSIVVNGNVTGAFLHATATGLATTAKIGSITIKGSLIGATGDDSAGATDDTGEVAASDGIGAVKILGSIIGGSGKQSGRVGTGPGGKIGSVAIGGNIVGGSNDNSGEVESGAGIGAVAVKGEIEGGSAFRSGLIHAKTLIASTSVGGSVIGGTFGETGGIESDGDLGTVKILGDLRGIDFTTTSSSPNFKHTGFVLALGRISGGVSVGGSLIAGMETGGTLSFSGSIQAGHDIGAVTVLGSLVGNSATPVIISGVGQAVKTKTDVAIKSVAIGGGTDFAQIMGGYDTTGASADGDAQLGAIKIGSNMIASSIVSGIESTTPFDPNFGAADKVIATNNTAAIHSAIASITVGGQIVGTVSPTTDSFGIEAQF
ncbi:MAG TPA: hypothetical protein VEO95_13715, partial [Chthoniobacteraceae bacterium]|nr:hypothetical protein [Chthoniobacteraceae bacterium]